MKIITMSVKSVPKCLSIRAILDDISRACIRERSLTSVLCVRKGLVSLGPFTDTFELCTGVRNHIPVRVVVKTFQRKVISCYTFGLYTMERSLTVVLCVTKVLVRVPPLTFTSRLYTMARNPTSVLCAVEGLGGASILDAIFGVYTTVRSGTRGLIAVKLLPVSRV